MNGAKSGIIIGLCLIFGMSCTFRTVRTDDVEEWPPSSGWQRKEREKPRLSLIIRKPEGVLYSEAGEERFQLWHVGNMSNSGMAPLVLDKLLESGMFQTVSLEPGGKSDLTLEVGYIEKAADFSG